MKNLLKILFPILLLSQAFGQGIIVEPYFIRFNPNISLSAFNSSAPAIRISSSSNTLIPSLILARNNLLVGAITGSSSYDFLTYTNQGYKFQISNITDYVTALRISPTGNVGIGTESPETKLEVNGFTKLGSDAPAIKIKKLTSGCTTSANSGFPSGEISLTHGITPSKILKVEALVEYATNFWVKDGNDLFGYEFDVYVTNTTISLRNLSGSASSEIRSKPCKILITYEE
ncbi:hypothetical protein GCM10027035_26040 [Emticicia sediminis]